MNLFYVNYKDTYFYVISNLKSRFFFVFIFYHPDIDEPDIDEPPTLFNLFFFNQKGGSKELTTPEYIKLRREICTNGGDQTKTPLSRTKPKARHT
jgi:hypothetical protein